MPKPNLRFKKKLRLKPATRERLEAEARRRGLDLPVQVNVPCTAIWAPRAENIPQQQAFASEADEIYYGGAAGGGKTDFALGMAIEKHTKSIIFRREYEQLKDVIARSKELLEDHARYNENTKMWRGIHGNKTIEFGGMQREDDKKKFKGRPHDAKIFDELTEFSESQFEFVIAWNRTTVPGQKCRIIATFNPPTDPEGEWIIRRLAPWLDRTHPNPAKPGELRWFVKKDDEDVEVLGPEPIQYNGETLQPKSRTFLPAMLEDNPDLRDTEYRAQLQSLPEPLRSQLLFGNFQATAKDHPRQVIPTEWVLRAQKRWRERRHAEGYKPPSTPMTSLGVDVSRGGKDKTVIAPRYDNIISELFCYQGEETSDGGKVATLVLSHHKDSAFVSMDALGVGTSPYDILTATPGISVNGINSSEGSSYRDKSGRYRLVNLRAELWWRLREALDPRSGEAIELPDDRELLADLCAPRFEVQKSGIKIESKDDIKERIGRSPDKGEAVLYAFDDAGAIEFFSL